MPRKEPETDPAVLEVESFLHRPIPPEGTRDWRKWLDRCRNLPDKTPEILVDTLKRGTPSEQQVAIVALRHHGYEAWETGGRGSATRYILRPEGEREWQVILPLLQVE